MSNKIVWERLDPDTEQAPFAGGLLIRSIIVSLGDKENFGLPANVAVSIIFISARELSGG